MNEPNNITTTDELASLWKRTLGAGIDIFIMIIFLMPAAWAGGIVQLINDRKDVPPDQILSLTRLKWSVYVLLNGYLLANYGQTIGKRIARTRIVTMDGKRPTLVQLLVYRYFAIQALSLIPFAGFAIQTLNVLQIFNKDRRCIHDHLAGTKVIKVS